MHCRNNIHHFLNHGGECASRVRFSHWQALQHRRLQPTQRLPEGKHDPSRRVRCRWCSPYDRYVWLDCVGGEPVGRLPSDCQRATSTIASNWPVVGVPVVIWVVADQRQASADVPPFSVLAWMPNFSPEKVAFFLLEPHPKMPNLALSRREADDILALRGCIKARLVSRHRLTNGRQMRSQVRSCGGRHGY